MRDHELPVAIGQEDKTKPQREDHDQRVADHQLDPVHGRSLEGEVEIFPVRRPHDFAIELGVEGHRDEAEADVEEEREDDERADHPDAGPLRTAEAISGKAAGRSSDHAADHEDEGREVEEQETGKDIARIGIGFEAVRAEAHLAHALVPQARHRPGDGKAKRQIADEGLPHVGQAVGQALIVAPAANSAPARARQAVSQRAEASEAGQVEYRE